MSKELERRSSAQRIRHNASGVGGRHDRHTPAARGVGTKISAHPVGFEFRAPPGQGVALSEIAKLGLPDPWIAVAYAIGPDSFLVAWEILDRMIEPAAGSEDRAKISVPRFSRYLRYQRNQLIEAMMLQGHGALETQDKIKTLLREKTTLRNIVRIRTKARRRLGL